MVSLYSGSAQRRRVIFIQRTGSNLNPACKQLKRGTGEGQYYLKQGFPTQESRLSSRELITYADFCICLQNNRLYVEIFDVLTAAFRRDISSDAMLLLTQKQVSTYRIKLLHPYSGSMLRKLRFHSKNLGLWLHSSDMSEERALLLPRIT